MKFICDWNYIFLVLLQDDVSFQRPSELVGPIRDKLSEPSSFFISKIVLEGLIGLKPKDTDKGKQQTVSTLFPQESSCCELYISSSP